MIPNVNKIHGKFKLHGECYNESTLKELAYEYVKEGLPFQNAIGNFLLDWLNKNDFIEVKTSGSTGNPKLIAIKKQSMVNSAIVTGDYFKLLPGSRALHCLPTEFIAGKMILIRALVLGLELDVVAPNSQPLLNNKKLYDFCAMVPLQLENSINDLSNIKTLIVGGASVSLALQEQLQNLSCNVYATYGMTETVTHIAVKKLNNFSSLRGGTTWQSAESVFNTLPNIEISKDDRDCLVINAPQLNNELVVTNDVVELTSKTSFKLLGRIDNVINSGGVKLFPEQIEHELAKVIEQRFFIASKKDNTLGVRLILVIEGTSNIENIKKTIKRLPELSKFENPKEIVSVPRFIETTSGKVQRAKTLELLKE